MQEQDLIAAIETGWQELTAYKKLSPATRDALREPVRLAMDGLDAGHYRVAEKLEDSWHTHQWLKMAILLAFKLNKASLQRDAGGMTSFDVMPLKFAKWTGDDFLKADIRAVPGNVVRHSAYIAPGAVLMPSFVNAGARVGEGTMIDAWATVGSCAQVGSGCHISGGAGLGGVLEPLQANPTIIEDGCFIGARSEVVEGVIVEQGSVLSMGVFIGASTKIVDRETGETFTGHVPPYSVVVPGTLPAEPLENGQPGPAKHCAMIVKRVDAKTRSKTSTNELLRSLKLS